MLGIKCIDTEHNCSHKGGHSVKRKEGST